MYSGEPKTRSHNDRRKRNMLAQSSSYPLEKRTTMKASCFFAFDRPAPVWSKTNLSGPGTGGSQEDASVRIYDALTKALVEIQAAVVLRRSTQQGGCQHEPAPQGPTTHTPPMDKGMDPPYAGAACLKRRPLFVRRSPAPKLGPSMSNAQNLKPMCREDMAASAVRRFKNERMARAHRNSHRRNRNLKEVSVKMLGQDMCRSTYLSHMQRC